MRKPRISVTALLAISALAVGCKSRPSSSIDAGAGGSGSGGSGAGGTAADAGDGERVVTLRFSAVVGDEDAECGRTYRLGTPEVEAELLDLRFYVSNVRLLTSDGDEVPIELEQDTPFQTQNVALLDFEDASAACAASGSEQTNDAVAGTVPAGDYVGVGFDLGVPFELNHRDPLTNESPLDVQSLFWNWLPGHKFVRIDVLPRGSSDAGPPSQWNFHLGSIMCVQDVAEGEALNPMAPPSGPCGRPNLPSYELSGFDPDADSIELDLAALFQGSDIETNLGGMTPGCMSFPPDQPDCERIFENVGLDYGSGSCENDCEDQSVFSVK